MKNKLCFPFWLKNANINIMWRVDVRQSVPTAASPLSTDSWDLDLCCVMDQLFYIHISWFRFLFVNKPYSIYQTFYWLAWR